MAVMEISYGMAIIEIAYYHSNQRDYHGNNGDDTILLQQPRVAPLSW